MYVCVCVYTHASQIQYLTIDS